MNKLLEWDHYLFSKINGLHFEHHLDAFFTLWRHSMFWIPVYAFIALFFIFNYKKNAYWFILFSLLTVASSDILSSQLIKKSIHRTRPCNTELVGLIERVPCGNGYSFTSSHAANHFALSAFLFVVFGPVLRRKKWLLMFWAATVSLAQIYVGKHYPLDILFGALLGVMIGWFWSKIFLMYYGHILEIKQKMI